jgi:hypothetical protein
MLVRGNPLGRNRIRTKPLLGLLSMLYPVGGAANLVEHLLHLGGTAAAI